VNPSAISVKAQLPEQRGWPLPNPFDVWANVYDEQSNPLLQLEQRYLVRMLPAIHSLDVLDAGCGTGRWLKTFVSQSPRTLTGVDASDKMLARAREKLNGQAELIAGECVALPVSPQSKDLILVSFVISYIRDLNAFASECKRVCRARGDLFLTDMHPATAQTLGWKRSFKSGDLSVEIEPRSHRLPSILSCFQAHGFKLTALMEPTFGASEEHLLRMQRKGDVIDATAHLPPIYLLHLKNTQTERETPAIPLQLRLAGGRVSLGANESAFASIGVDQGRSETIVSSSIPLRDAFSSATIDLSDYLVLPGLVNAHDHLEFGLFPNLGHGPYANAEQWADDIHRVDSEVIERHRAVPKDVRLWWGAIRNLLCGVTTVCHHNPLVPSLLAPEFPVRVVSRFCWAHSLALDPDLARHFYSTWPARPFILHAAEGIDDRSANEVLALDRMNALDSRTVLVHGLALTPDGVSLVNQRGAAVVLCPSSNHFLFNSVPSPEVVGALHHKVLGSDSSLTAIGDLLDEIRFARSSLGLASDDLYEMVTSRVARILCLDDGEGHITPGGSADLIAVRDCKSSPAETLAGMRFDDVELVIVGGRVQLASSDVLARLPEEIALGLQPIDVDGHLRWIRAPLPWLFAEATKFLGPDLRLGGKRVTLVDAL
jgi:cytosine/adenosine deaminase-related metal-dependent hydrolase/ubiquinone/menaquinone biosynthesis C-methylase UbiE